MVKWLIIYKTIHPIAHNIKAYSFAANCIHVYILYRTTYSSQFPLKRNRHSNTRVLLLLKKCYYFSRFISFLFMHVHLLVFLHKNDDIERTLHYLLFGLMMFDDDKRNKNVFVTFSVAFFFFVYIRAYRYVVRVPHAHCTCILHKVGEFMCILCFAVTIFSL